MTATLRQTVKEETMRRTITEALGVVAKVAGKAVAKQAAKSAAVHIAKKKLASKECGDARKQLAGRSRPKRVKEALPVTISDLETGLKQAVKERDFVRANKAAKMLLMRGVSKQKVKALAAKVNYDIAAELEGY